MSMLIANVYDRIGRAWRWQIKRPGIVFLAWSLWLSVGSLVFGSSSFVRIQDNGDASLPMVLAGSARSAASWSTLQVCGVDGAALGRHPAAVFFGFLPDWLAHGLLVGGQRFLAGYFMFRLLRDDLKLSALPCFFAGLSYSRFAQSFIAAWAGFTPADGLGLPGLPFLLWALLSLRDKRRSRALPSALGVGVLFGFGTMFAHAPFLVLPVFFWALVLSPERSAKLWSIIALVLVGWASVSWPAAWAASLNVALSHRAMWEVASPLSRSWSGSVDYVWQITSDNGLALGLAGVGVAVWRGRNKRLLWTSSALSLALVCIVCYEPIRGLLAGRLGFLVGFQFDRVYLVVPFLATVAGALSLDSLREGWDEQLAAGSAKKWIVGAKALALVLAPTVVLWRSLQTNINVLNEITAGSTFAASYHNPDMQELADKTAGSPPFRVATVAKQTNPQAHPGYAWTYGLETADGYLNLYPKRYQEFWEQVLGPLIRVDQKVYNYFHYWGNRVYLFPPSGGFPGESSGHLGSDVRFDDYYRLELLSLANVRYIVSPYPLRQEGLSLLPSAVRDEQARWAALSKGSKLLDILRGRAPGTPLFIYENRRAFPRYFLVGGARVLQNKSALLAALGRATHEELRSTAYFDIDDAKDVSLPPQSEVTGEVTILRQGSDRVELEVNSASAVILVASNSYSPYWRAILDDGTAPLFPVDHAFQGVVVGAGKHRVVFRYEPPYIR